jgi:Ras-related protein Rab-2A
MSGHDQWDYISKFILIGDSSVGKSSLLVRLTDNRFLADSEPTVGVEFGSQVIALENGERIKVQVWDTAGSESFRSVSAQLSERRRVEAYSAISS